jgi:hypothetical protein
MILEKQIREILIRHLRGEISLDEFEDWIVEHSWNMHLDSAKGAQEVVSAIELRLAEYSSGHLDYNDLRHDLQMILVHGPKLPQGNMLIINPLPRPNTTSISQTSKESQGTFVVVIGSRLSTSVCTRSASGHNVTAQETFLPVP